MPERTFFDYRYSLPGFTFILLTLLLNLETLSYIFLTKLPAIDPSNNITTLFGLFIGFLTILSGGALGFLVSQLWYLFYHLIVDRLLVRLYCRPLKKEFDVKDSKSCFEVFNYIVHEYPEERLFSYMSRRWDLLNLFGSTVFAIVLALLTGYSILPSVVDPPTSGQNIVNWENLELMVLGFSVLLIFSLIIIMYRVAKRNYAMGVFVIRMKAKKLAQEEVPKKLRDWLPEIYFNSDLAPNRKEKQ